jgi:hypothetical protein
MAEILVALGIVGVAVALAVGGMLAVRRGFAPHVLERHNDVAGFIYAVLGVLYGALLAFVVVAAWERYMEAEEIVEREANALGDLYRGAGAYPEEVRRRFRAGILGYARAVVETEWVVLGEGIGSADAWRAYDAIWRMYLSYEPRTTGEMLWHRAAIDRLDDLGDARRLRLIRGEARMPGLFWLVLGVGGAVTIAFTYLFGLRNAWSHGLMVGTVAGTLALVLVLVHALERPYSGLAAARPDAFVELLTMAEQGSEP